MTDQLISFETAKLAKEKGFNEECDWNYCIETYDFPTGLHVVEGNIYRFRLGVIRNACAPTQSLLQKWLRDEHKIHITIYSSSQESWMFRITKPHQKLLEGLYAEDFETYEEALEEGLQEALKLIK